MHDTEFSLTDDTFNELEAEIESARPDKVIPVALGYDFSASMKSVTKDGSGTSLPRIEGVRLGIESLLNYCKSVPFLRNSVQLGVGRFGREVAFEPFKRVDEVRLPALKAGGSTPLGQFLHLALDAIQDQVCRLDDEERRFSISNLCIVSDGAPDAGPELDAEVARAAKLVKSGDLSISLVGIDRTDCQRLERLGLSGAAYCVSELSWEEVIKQATLGGGGTASQHDAA